MTIPPKYEDLVLKVAELERREDALREELDAIKRVGPPHFCGLPMSLNPHAEAGKPGRFLEVGAHRECIPCLVSSRHGWAKTAGELQQRLTVAEQREAELKKLLCDVINEAPTGFAALKVDLANRVNDALKPAAEDDSDLQKIGFVRMNTKTDHPRISLADMHARYERKPCQEPQAHPTRCGCED